MSQVAFAMAITRAFATQTAELAFLLCVNSFIDAVVYFQDLVQGRLTEGEGSVRSTSSLC
jgi:hypothetical protein